MFLAYQSVMTTRRFLSTSLVIVNCLIVHQASHIRYGGLMITNNLAGLRTISCRYVANLCVKTASSLPLIEELT